MNSTWTVNSLKDFEKKVADLFNSGKIRAPVHLSDGTENNLIEIFKDVKDQDWVLCSWRSHYQCLLKGVPPEKVMGEIVNGKSISLGFPEFKIISSAIVGGNIPIALGVALSEKINKSSNHVWCFMGDMTSETGIAQTSIRYAEKHDLPVTFIVEDNDLSVQTKTRKVWQTKTLRIEENMSNKVIHFKYKSRYPHAGAGQRILF
jgi:pyruvate dehydrogenase E1 component alpha subunit